MCRRTRTTSLALSLALLLAAPAGATVNEKINFAGGYAPAEWDYEKPSTAESAGVHGWSYYMRAFNLLREQPQEMGWGQWSKPASPRQVCL